MVFMVVLFKFCFYRVPVTWMLEGGPLFGRGLSGTMMWNYLLVGSYAGYVKMWINMWDVLIVWEIKCLKASVGQNYVKC